ncbi:hypothetical protein ASPWEDRAFT_618951 [Aspergillus wentii DTO 134E9]|uniref:Uncharacterized protein n=1 Tax=Aspergillus wentii DTO 134E9 TaxID=1073089 RepID=A0A1L9REK6_ASPWE|nr:uncharacterized protein ASPWEDRAFT_618951 [Aspergillus wentii DTO 134E9]OJJ33307.1 hypothetical protein ASPWEDRAFT_618951 [Aspergillus wentii DTO 134E9]
MASPKRHVYHTIIPSLHYQYSISAQWLRYNSPMQLYWAVFGNYCAPRDNTFAKVLQGTSPKSARKYDCTAAILIDPGRIDILGKPYFPSG